MKDIIKVCVYCEGFTDEDLSKVESLLFNNPDVYVKTYLHNNVCDYTHQSIQTESLDISCCEEVWIFNPDKVEDRLRRSIDIHGKAIKYFKYVEGEIKPEDEPARPVERYANEPKEKCILRVTYCPNNTYNVYTDSFDYPLNYHVQVLRSFDEVKEFIANLNIM